MDCPVALSLLRRGFEPKHRVFFVDEETAIAAGFRPCGACCGALRRVEDRVGEQVDLSGVGVGREQDQLVAARRPRTPCIVAARRCRRSVAALSMTMPV